MAMSPRLILGYLHHAQAVGAIERLEAISSQALPYQKGPEQRREIERLRRVADGLPALTPAEEHAQRQAGWDAAWDRLRGRLGTARSPQKAGSGPRLAPGERIVIPEG
jgi:hypothetical protein